MICLNIEYIVVFAVQSDEGWSLYCAWCAKPAAKEAGKAYCSACKRVVCRPCMERNFDPPYGADQCDHTTKHRLGHAWRCPVCNPDQLTPSGEPQVVDDGGWVAGAGRWHGG